MGRFVVLYISYYGVRYDGLRVTAYGNQCVTLSLGFLVCSLTLGCFSIGIFFKIKKNIFVALFMHYVSREENIPWKSV